MKEPEDINPLDTLPKLKDYPRPDEPEVEDLPKDWEDEDREISGRTPDLGEIEEDPSEM
jgi:hypothetical protein